MYQSIRLIPAAGAAVLLLAFTAGRAEGSGYENHDRIRAAAENHAAALAAALAPAGASVEVTAGRLDSRLRLPACPVAPESFTNAGQAGLPSSIGVRCPEGAPWSLYVPVRVEVIAEVLVLSSPGNRGERLTADRVSLEPRDISRLTRGYMSGIEEIEGMVLRRQVQLGTVLDASMVERERIVLRGERVRLSAGRELLAVSVEGEALGDAARGERVRVRNLASGRIIEGTVTAAGRVAIRR